MKDLRVQLPPGGQFCSRTQVAVGSAGQGVRRNPPLPAKATHAGGAAYLPGTLAERVQAVGVGLPTPPPQQQRPLPGSIGRPCFPDSGRGGCTRPRLRGCPRRRLKGPSRCRKLARTSHAGPEITTPLQASMSESPGPEPLFPGFAFLLRGLSGHYRSHSNRRAVSCPSHACSEIKRGRGRAIWKLGKGRGSREELTRGRRALCLRADLRGRLY